jgi:SAM-dependent methyltransferase
MMLAMETRNVCSGPFGAVYDYYIERPRLARLVLGLMWGVDPRPFYESLSVVGELADGATILDVPCGGGVALRSVRAGQRVRWIDVDLEPAMLRRAERRAARFPHVEAQLIEGETTRPGAPHAKSLPVAVVGQGWQSAERCQRLSRHLPSTMWSSGGALRSRAPIRSISVSAATSTS